MDQLPNLTQNSIPNKNNNNNKILLSPDGYPFIIKTYSELKSEQS